jgi:hypothetical protein
MDRVTVYLNASFHHLAGPLTPVGLQRRNSYKNRAEHVRGHPSGWNLRTNDLQQLLYHLLYLRLYREDDTDNTFRHTTVS